MYLLLIEVSGRGAGDDYVCFAITDTFRKLWPQEHEDVSIIDAQQSSSRLEGPLTARCLFHGFTSIYLREQVSPHRYSTVLIVYSSLGSGTRRDDPLACPLWKGSGE